MAEDARYRTRVYLEEYLVDTNLTEDDTETLIESYSETNFNNDYFPLQSLHPSSTEGILSAASQCFLTSTSHKLTSAKFYLQKYGSPIGNAHATLYLMTGTYGTDGEPTGTALATSNAFDVSTLTTDWQLITLTFPQHYLMAKDTYYCIAFENPTAGTIDINNCVRVGVDSAAPSHAGNAAYFVNGVWFGLDFDDTIFYVYAEKKVTFITAFADADYPLVRVFTDKAVDLVFCVGTPDSVALPVGVGYDEKVPITIWCIDKTGITGTKLRWKAEAELRRITETYPTGSLRTFQRLSDNEKNLGSTILYSVNYVINYKRYS